MKIIIKSDHETKEKLHDNKSNNNNNKMNLWKIEENSTLNKFQN